MTLKNRESLLTEVDLLLSCDTFLRRNWRYKRLGTALAAHIGEHGAEAEIFASALGRASANHGDDHEFCGEISHELIRQGLYLLPGDILKMLLAEQDLIQFRRSPQEPQPQYGFEPTLRDVFSYLRRKRF